MADVDTGGGNAVNAAWITERLIAMGVAGMNIEDQVFPKRCGHMAGKEVISAEEMAGKVRACADVRDRLDKDFIINARTDVFAGAGPRRGHPALQPLPRGRRRPGLHRRHQEPRPTSRRPVKSIKGPLSVNLMDAITGMKTELIPIPELAKMGVGPRRRSRWPPSWSPTRP
ncbi:MAG: isocitrate lyase/PEP mutase family protein [Anaerotruncus sp.]|nr:isocitrate lyase/PEP mutase family protein [Anaerotruncus sp.]